MGGVGALAALVLAVALLLGSGLDVPVIGSGSGDRDQLKAVILDQLDLTAPNPGFISEVRQMLEADGYEVDYLPGAQVSVDAYRDLPEGDYDLIILRVHSTAEVSRGDDDVTSVSLFTGQDYDEDLYYEEQLRGAVGFAQYTEDSPKLFGVTAEFIRTSMKGDFDDAIVLMMGCQGFINAEGAEAFADRGARIFVGWDGLVTADHTDETFQVLLRHLVEDDLDMGTAIERTMDEIGPDPAFGSELVARP